MAKAPTVPDRNFEAMLNRVEGSIRQRFMEAISFITNEADRAAIEDAIARKDTGAVFRALNIPPSFFEPLDRAIDQAYYDGATREGQLIAKASGDAMHIHFNGRHRRAETFVRETGARLVAEITNDVRESVRQVVERGIAEGRNPRDVSLDLVGRIPPGEKQRKGGIIGLLEREAVWVANARRELETGDANYFTRQARNRRGDASVAAAFAANKIPPEAVRNKLTADYADRLLVLRGERIGRTEAIRALNAGRYEASRQLVEKGDMPRTAVSYIWDATLSKRTRDSHLHLNGDEVGFDEQFRSPITGALLRFPGDTALGAPGSETINCRCTMRTRIDRRQLATKRPRGRPVGSTNRPKVDPPTLTVLPPVPAPAPAPLPLVPPPRPPRAREPLHPSEIAKDFTDEYTGFPSATLNQEREAVTIAADLIERFGMPRMRSFRGPMASRDPRAGSSANAWCYFGGKREIVLTDNLFDDKKRRDARANRIAWRDRNGPAHLEKLVKSSSFNKAEKAIARDIKEFTWAFADTRVALDEEGDVVYQMIPRVVTHEFGHYFHDYYYYEVENLIPTLGWRAWAKMVSGYAMTSKEEFIAETFAMYNLGTPEEHKRMPPELLAFYRSKDKRYANPA